MRNRIFCVFLVDFHSARLFFAIYVAFCGFFVIFFGSGWGGDELGSILSFCTLCVFAFFGRFWHFLAFFGFQWRFGHFDSTSEL